MIPLDNIQDINSGHNYKRVEYTRRDYAIDFMKCLAAVMITNSHFQPLYSGVNEGFATFGVHGNALFFFVAGFLLMSGFKKNPKSFVNWYQKRMQRLWPTFFIWVSFAGLLFGSIITFQKLFLFTDYWFIQCIVVYYALYFALCSQPKFERFGGGKFVYAISILISIVAAFVLPKSQVSLFHSEWHYICHFSAMLLGGICYSSGHSHKKSDWMICLLSFVGYFLIMKLGKGQTTPIYYIQVLALIPLHVFLWYCYKVCSRDQTKKLFERQLLGRFLQVVSALTLEIYVVQFHVISEKWNVVPFPFNILMVFVVICLTAYILRLAVNTFIQFLSKEEWNLSEILRLY